MALTNPGSPITVIADDIPERASCQYAMPELFPLLGITPAAGRFPGLAELRQGTKSVVISEGYWHRRFGGTALAIGKTGAFNGELHIIAGTATVRDDLLLWVQSDLGTLQQRGARDRLEAIAIQKIALHHAIDFGEVALSDAAQHAEQFCDRTIGQPSPRLVIPPVWGKLSPGLALQRIVVFKPA